MVSFKSSPIFYSLLAVLGLAAVGSGWFIYERGNAAQLNHKALIAKRAELNKLLAASPGPSTANDAAVKDDLVRSQAALTQMRAELKGRGPAAEALQAAVEAYASSATLSASEYTENLRLAKIPSEPTHLFFNITSFVEAMREAAQSADIKLKTDERFGFNTYANSGPDKELIPQVFRQRQVAEYLIRALVNARPSELISFHRELPVVSAAESSQPAKPASPATRGSSTTVTDFFEIDPRITARVPGFVNASAFKLTFIGDTEALRVLLNKLATFELPLVVRSVEVQPLTKTNSLRTAVRQTTVVTQTADGDAPEKPKPIVEKAQSTFTVTVELIDLVVNTPEATSNL